MQFVLTYSCIFNLFSEPLQYSRFLKDVLRKLDKNIDKLRIKEEEIKEK